MLVKLEVTTSCFNTYSVTTSSYQQSEHSEDKYGKQMFTLVYPEQFSDDGEGEWEEVVDWNELTERLRCHRTWEDEQRLKEKRKKSNFILLSKIWLT